MRSVAARLECPIFMDQKRRFYNLLGFVICSALLGYALYSEHVLHLEPCPLCMFQRVCVFALGVTFLLAALHHPRSWGRYVYAALIGLGALATIVIAGRHVWVQSQPAGSVPACGAPLEAMLDMFPVMEVVRKVLTGGGECADVNWSFLGLSMPMWVLVFAAAMGIAGVVVNSVRRYR